jgi:hypothetical protein
MLLAGNIAAVTSHKHYCCHFYTDVTNFMPLVYCDWFPIGSCVEMTELNALSIFAIRVARGCDGYCACDLEILVMFLIVPDCF